MRRYASLLLADVSPWICTSLQVSELGARRAIKRRHTNSVGATLTELEESLAKLPEVGDSSEICTHLQEGHQS